MPTDDANALPSAPPELIAMLREGETRHADLSAEYRRLRESLEAQDARAAGSAAERLDGAIRGTVHAVLPALTGSVTGTVSSPADVVSAPGVRRYLDLLKDYGPAGANIISTVVRLWAGGA